MNSAGNSGFCPVCRRAVEHARLRRHVLSNIGHELKTPLALVRLYTETLENDRVEGEAERKRFLGIIGYTN